MFSGLHLLLTYKCNFECDHCFVYSHPHAAGVMKISDVREILDEAGRLGNIKWIYFEGGEPFLYYQTMLWGLREAKRRGLKTGIVTNSYWATSVEDAREWLRPISEIGIDDLSISDDLYHYGETEENLAKYAHEAAIELGMPVGKIAIEDPKDALTEVKWKGKPVTAGSVQFKGRAVEKLTEGLPRRPWTEFNECPDEDFTNPGRVHIDPFGYVHLCQGITLGNMKKTPLHELVEDYDPETHPICAPLLKGGPAELVKKYDVEHEESYIDECHLCYSARLKLRDRFPEILAPDVVYGA
ncbi:MAG: radical SAM protein [Candidatus Thorarchaeota archaeon]